MVKQTKHSLQDLVVLEFAVNNRYMQVITVDQASQMYPHFSLDIDHGKWSYKSGKDISIGRKRSLQNVEDYEGVLGVYDKRNITHLDFMVKDAASSQCDLIRLASRHLAE